MSHTDTSDLEHLILSPAERHNCEQLPHLCFAYIACQPAGKRIVAIKRGECGYFTTTLDDPGLSTDHAKDIVAAYNERLEVSWEQQQAMINGSMFGWGAAGADPATYAGRPH